jgi:hypothetical protein
VKKLQSEAAAAARVAAGLGRRKRTELLTLMRPAFMRTEAWLQAARYTAAVLSDVPRRNGWTIAKVIVDKTPDRTQRLRVKDLQRRVVVTGGGQHRRVVAVLDSERQVGDGQRLAAAGRRRG